MYNSEEHYMESQENNYKESYPGSMQSGLKDNNQNYRPKNQISNVGIKSNGISGTYMRIIPKKPIHDYQKLYSQNMQLRQKIQILQDSNLKLKTRLAVADKQKQHILQQFRNMQNFSVLKDRRPSHTSLMKKNDKTHKFSVDENRKILNQYKDEIAKLKNENSRLKKSIKYTQIKEIELQNQYLQEEVKRMKLYVQDVIQNTEYEEYQKQIEKLNKLLQAEKDQLRSIHFQLKKKDEEIQHHKQTLKGLANRKMQLQKRYTRDINNMRAEVHRIKDKQKQAILNSINDKKQGTKSQHSNLRTIDCQKCKDKEKMIDNLNKEKHSLQEQIEEKRRQIIKMESETKQLKKENSKIIQENQQKSKELVLKEQNQKSNQAHQNKNETEENKQRKKTEGESVKKNQSAGVHQQSDEDLYKDNQEDLNLQSEEKDQIQMLHVDLDSQNGTMKMRNKKSEENEEYDAEFEQQNEIKKNIKDIKKESSQEEEQVLFQKQEQKKQKKRPASKKKKNKQKTGLSKAEKILKETIQYRLIAQRYTFQDLARDIRDSGAVQFSLEDLINMTTNQPFYLSQEHLQMILFKCFDKEELDQNDSISSQAFLKRVKPLIGHIQLNSEEQQEKILFNIHKKLSKVSSKLSKQFAKEGTSEYISKKGFVKVLKECAGLSEREIEQCLAQSSVGSVDIAHINFEQFKQKMLSVR